VINEGGVLSSFGSKTFTFTFDKDSSTTEGDDAAWIKSFTCSKRIRYNSPNYDGTSSTFVIGAPYHTAGIYDYSMLTDPGYFYVDFYPTLLDMDVFNTPALIESVPWFNLFGESPQSWDIGFYLTTETDPFYDPAVPTTAIDIDIQDSFGTWSAGGDGLTIYSSPCYYEVNTRKANIDQTYTGFDFDLSPLTLIENSCGFDIQMEPFEGEFLASREVTGTVTLTSPTGTSAHTFTLNMNPIEQDPVEVVLSAIAAVVVVALVVAGVALAVGFVMYPE